MDGWPNTRGVISAPRNFRKQLCRRGPEADLVAIAGDDAVFLAMD